MTVDIASEAIKPNRDPTVWVEYPLVIKDRFFETRQVFWPYIRSGHDAIASRRWIRMFWKMTRLPSDIETFMEVSESWYVSIFA